MDTLNALRGAFAPVLAELRGLGEALAGLFRPVGESLQASLAGALPAWDRVMYALGFGLGFLFGFLRGLLQRLAPIFGEGLAGVVRVIRGFVDVVVGLLTLDLDRARQGALRVWEGLRAVLSVPLRLAGVAWDAIRSGLEQALAWLRGLVDRMKQVGGQLVQGLVEGITSWAFAPVKAVENLASSVWEAIKSRLGIRSPSRVMAHLGMMAALGLAVGLQNMVPRVAQQAEALAQAATPRLKTLIPEVPVPRLPEAALPVGVEVPEVPPPPSRAPAESPGAAPSREARQVQQVIRIERLELPGVRDAQEFLEELKRLFLPYLEG